MKRIIAAIELSFFYFKEVIVSNLKVARDVLGKSSNIKPSIETVSLSDLSERQLFVLANMITMTPGTLSLDVDQSNKTLTLHTLYKHKPGELQEMVSNQFERRILNVF